MTEVTPDNAASAPEDFHDRLYGLAFKLFLNPNEDTPNNEVRLVLGATVGSGESEVAYFHAEQGVLHDAATDTALKAEVADLKARLVKQRRDAGADQGPVRTEPPSRVECH